MKEQYILIGNILLIVTGNLFPFTLIAPESQELCLLGLIVFNAIFLPRHYSFGNALVLFAAALFTFTVIYIIANWMGDVRVNDGGEMLPFSYLIVTGVLKFFTGLIVSAALLGISSFVWKKLRTHKTEKALIDEIGNRKP